MFTAARVASSSEEETRGLLEQPQISDTDELSFEDRLKMSIIKGNLPGIVSWYGYIQFNYEKKLSASQAQEIEAFAKTNFQQHGAIGQLYFACFTSLLCNMRAALLATEDEVATFNETTFMALRASYLLADRNLPNLAVYKSLISQQPLKGFLEQFSNQYLKLDCSASWSQLGDDFSKAVKMDPVAASILHQATLIELGLNQPLASCAASAALKS